MLVRIFLTAALLITFLPTSFAADKSPLHNKSKIDDVHSTPKDMRDIKRILDKRMRDRARAKKRLITLKKKKRSN